MTEYEAIRNSLFTPEACFFLSLPFKMSREWWFNMIEDSDGDPHHTDGQFIILLFAALWCFRVGLLAGLRIIYFQEDLIVVAQTFLGAAGALMGVRALARIKITGKNSPSDKPSV